MHGHLAYKQARNVQKTRIDTILSLYRKALQHLESARQALTTNQQNAARAGLLNTQLIVMGLASQLPAHKDKLAIDFLRLYEFVAHQMAQGGLDNIAAAERVLRPLMKGFETVRDQALALELQGKIPALDRDDLVSLTA